MFGENINAAAGSTWANPAARLISFMLPITPANVTASTLKDPTTAVAVTGANNPWINKMKSGPEGGRPYLNSNHPGIVVVSTCDGGARTLSEDINKEVYCQLITAAGSRLRNGLSVENPLSGDF